MEEWRFDVLDYVAHIPSAGDELGFGRLQERRSEDAQQKVILENTQQVLSQFLLRRGGGISQKRSRERCHRGKILRHA